MGRVSALIDIFRVRREAVDWPSTARPLTLAELIEGVERPRLYFEPETIEIPGGSFVMGHNVGVEAFEGPAHEVVLGRYWLGKYPVTNKQYAVFLRERPQQEEPKRVGWFLREPPPDKLNHPVTGVSWVDAMAYCDWLIERTALKYRLPSEAEWEKAARGLEGWLFPWGDDWEDGRCHVAGEDTAEVTTYKNGASGFDVIDLLGNVEEWTMTVWGDAAGQPRFGYPYVKDDGREERTADAHFHRIYRVHRGGSYRNTAEEVRSTARGRATPNSRVRWRARRPSSKPNTTSPFRATPPSARPMPSPTRRTAR
jgi:formylglycine-generating enzyme required for sulfatase activity